MSIKEEKEEYKKGNKCVADRFKKFMTNLPFKDVMNDIYCWFEKNHPSVEFDQPDKLIRHAITFETEGAFYFKDGSEFVLPEIILQQPTPKEIARRKRAIKKLNKK